MIIPVGSELLVNMRTYRQANRYNELYMNVTPCTYVHVYVYIKSQAKHKIPLPFYKSKFAKFANSLQWKILNYFVVVN